MNLLNKEIKEIGFDVGIYEKLINNHVVTIRDLWCSNKFDLKSFNLNCNEINQIKIKMQLLGLDLNKKTYDNK